MATPATNAPKTLPEGFTGIWIPAAIYAFPELDASDREIIGCVNGFNQSGRKYVSVSYIAHLTGLHRTNVSKRVTKLEINGFLKRTDRNIKTGGANVLKVTKKSLGFNHNDFESELQANEIKGCASTLQVCEAPLLGVAPALHDNKTDNKNINTTTTTEKKDFCIFTLCLINLIQEMISETNLVQAGQEVPNPTWLRAKAKSLFEKFPDPRPEDCAVLILKDWTKLISTSGKLTNE